MPNDENVFMEAISPTGCVTRMDNFLSDISHKIDGTEHKIIFHAAEAKAMEGLLGKPFAGAADLQKAIEDHGKVQRALMKANATAAVRPSDMAQFEIAVKKQKGKLVSLGFGEAVREIESEDVDLEDVDSVIETVAVAAVDSLVEIRVEALDGAALDDNVLDYYSSCSVDLACLKTRIVDALPDDIQPGWIVMNAPRPLLGTEIFKGDFISGRFYSAIDPDDLRAEKFIAENHKLDGRLLVPLSKEYQMELVLVGNKYRDQYMAYDAERRYESLSGQIAELKDIPYEQLKAKISILGVASTKSDEISSTGLFSGQVMDIVDGLVLQKINRGGEVARHALSSLSVSVDIGDIVDINYYEGKGIVSASVEVDSQAVSC